MSLAEIEAALPELSAVELARVEAALNRVRRERGAHAHSGDRDVRLDGKRWPGSPEETAALLTELDALPPLLTPEEATRFEEWRLAEKELQKRLSAGSGGDISHIFA
jgi:hypothetical protein